MRLVITADHVAGDGIELLLAEIQSSNVKTRFAGKNYGAEVNMIGVVIRNLAPDVRFKGGSKWHKNEHRLFMDIIMPVGFSQLGLKRQRELLAGLILSEIPRALLKHNIGNLDIPTFRGDIQLWLKEMGWLEGVGQ